MITAHPRDLGSGADRNRTDGLRLARAALSHLSYSPAARATLLQVGLGRVELPTLPLSGVRSSQLSYRPHVRQSFKTREEVARTLDRSTLTWRVVRSAPNALADARLLRKEVIQPQVPLRLPCYDFTPVTSHTIGGYPPCGLKHRLPVQLTPMV